MKSCELLENHVPLDVVTTVHRLVAGHFML